MQSPRIILFLFTLCALLFFFSNAQAQFLPDTTVTIDLTLTDTTVIEQGDTLGFDVEITNHTNDTLEVDGWFTILPDSNGSETLIPASLLCVPTNPYPLTIPGNASKEKSCWLRIPVAQDPGWYTLFGKVGDYVNIDSLVFDEDSIRFEVVEAGTLMVNPWDIEEYEPLNFKEWQEFEDYMESFIISEE